jgi:hypothetical protein
MNPSTQRDFAPQLLERESAGVTAILYMTGKGKLQIECADYNDSTLADNQVADKWRRNKNKRWQDSLVSDLYS